MYGKVFESIYDGTLAGHWQAIVTMQQLIVLADENGVVDMTAEAIARRTTIPLKIITAGLAHLAQPDPFSRTPGEEGRRIELLDEHRPWGWRLVNYGKYRALRNMEQKREADRARMEEKRSKNKSVATGSQGVAKVAHADTDTDADTEAKRSKALAPSASPSTPPDPVDVVEKIPLCDGTEYPVTKSFVAELDRLYPAVDPAQTLREIRGWCIGNPRRTKTPRGVKGFITSWFAREQDKQSRRVS